MVGFSMACRTIICQPPLIDKMARRPTWESWRSIANSGFSSVTKLKLPPAQQLLKSSRDSRPSSFFLRGCMCDLPVPHIACPNTLSLSWVSPRFALERQPLWPAVLSSDHRPSTKAGTTHAVHHGLARRSTSVCPTSAHLDLPTPQLLCASLLLAAYRTHIHNRRGARLLPSHYPLHRCRRCAAP
jgi:hypothetical protein